MKTTLAFLAAPLLAASPLLAQDSPREGQELLDLFERMHRDGATEEDLRKMLGDKALLDLRVPDSPEKPDDHSGNRRKVEEAFRRDVERGQFRKLDAPEPQERTWRIGLMLEPLPDIVRDHFGLNRGEGVRISMVENGSPAHRLGLEVNDIVLSAGGQNIGKLEDLKEVVERAGREGEPLKITWIHRGERKSGKVRPQGPPEQAERQEGQPGQEGRPGDEGAPQRPAMMMRRMEEMVRRMERQQREIEELRREIEKLKRESRAEE